VLPKQSEAGRHQAGREGDIARRPFARRSTHTQVLNEVGERILCGVFAAGATMPSETALSDELQVSRPVLREAIKVLAAKGLVDSRPKIGTRVKPREDWNMLDPDILAWGFASPEAEQYAIALSEMRRVLEPAAAALAARRATDAQIERISRAYDRMASAAEDSEDSFAGDLAFHKAILAATGNAFLASTGHVIDSALLFSFKLSSRNKGARTHSLPRHAAVLETIAARDPQAARHEMELLLDEAWADIAALLGVETASAPGDKLPVRIGKVRRKQ
jgi:DNA-binding FadR family transcriptional regulator